MSRLLLMVMCSTQADQPDSSVDQLKSFINTTFSPTLAFCLWILAICSLIGRIVDISEEYIKDIIVNPKVHFFILLFI